jgi:hypothetical protein
MVMNIAPSPACERDLMQSADAVALLDHLHEAQNQFYGGGDSAALAELLAPDITWTVPGNNQIVGRPMGMTRSRLVTIAVRPVVRAASSGLCQGKPRSTRLCRSVRGSYG